LTPQGRTLSWRLKLALRDARYLAAAGLVILAITGVACFAIFLPESHLTRAGDRAELANSVLTSLAVFGAGMWALFTFVIFRTGVTNLEIRIATDAVPYGSGKHLVVVTVGLKNVGKVRVTPGRQGCRLWVFRLPIDVPAGSLLPLSGGEPLVDGHDLIGGYDPSAPYEIEPGTEYHEMGAVVANDGDVLGIRVTFYLGDRIDDAISESTVVRAA